VEQFHEDVVYYRRQQQATVLVGLVYDPEGALGEPRLVETACSRVEGELEVRCIVAG
jgi:hypothetical protein